MIARQMDSPPREAGAVRLWCFVFALLAVLPSRGSPPPPADVASEADRALEKARIADEAGRYTEALPLALRALALREKAVGTDSLPVAEALVRLASVQRGGGESDAAAQSLVRAITIRETRAGPDDPSTAEAVNRLGEVAQDRSDYDLAERSYRRALAIWRVRLGPDAPNTADSLNNLAGLLETRGDHAGARTLCEQALAVRERAFGGRHLDVAQSLNLLGNILQSMGDYEGAQARYERALSIDEELLGPWHPEMARPLNDLASLFLDEYALDRAEAILQRVLAIRERALGPDHRLIANTASNLGMVYFYRGAYERAEPLYLRAISIRERSKATEVSLASFYNNLAMLYEAEGAPDRAIPLFERALAIREQRLGHDSPSLSTPLNNLACVLRDRGDYARAAEQMERALALRERELGSQHMDVANSLNALAEMDRLRGDRSGAEKRFSRARAIVETAVGPDHPNLANPLSGLAALRVEASDLPTAEALYRRALAVREQALGAAHPEVARTLYRLAEVLLRAGRSDEALRLMQRAFSLDEVRLRSLVGTFSEGRLRSFLDRLREDDNRIYELPLRLPDRPAARRLAFAAALLRKGRSAEEMTVLSQAIHAGLPAGEREQFARLRALRTQMVSLAFASSPAADPDAARRQEERVRDEADRIEQLLAPHSALLRDARRLPGPETIVEAVAALLPKDGALIEYAIVRPTLATPGTAAPPRFLALVLRRTRRGSLVDAVDLGPAGALDAAVARFRSAVAGPRSDALPAARAAFDRLLRPLVPFLRGTRHLALSPDGELHQVAFAALHDGSRFALDRFRLRVVTSGADFLRPAVGPRATEIVVVADPDFGAAGQLPSGIPTVVSRRALRGESPARSGPWVPLPGTRQEAEAIHALLPRAHLLLGPDATREALLAVAAPTILHVATHGLFLDDGQPPVATSRGLGEVGELSTRLPPPPVDPLLRSALVLAGASRQSRPGAGRRADQEGLATALEIAGMDLLGTQLVVLSACDTGRGLAPRGEGVFGLRRAFTIAGAEAVIASLWRVDDARTRDLMSDYYRRLLGGSGRRDALDEAMRGLRDRYPHPYYWAPFVLIGRETPIAGLSVDNSTQ